MLHHEQDAGPLVAARTICLSLPYRLRLLHKIRQEDASLCRIAEWQLRHPIRGDGKHRRKDQAKGQARMED